MARAAMTARKMPMRTNAPTTKTPTFSRVPSASSMASPRLPAPESHLVTHRAVVEVEGGLAVALPAGLAGLHPVVRHHRGRPRRALPQDPEGGGVTGRAAAGRLRGVDVHVVIEG